MTVYRVKVVYGFYEEVFYEYYVKEEHAERATEYYADLEDYSAGYREVEVAEGEVELDDYLYEE